ncbi:MAG: cell division protein FtsQ/DivIB [Burkholderiales bacterium]
MSDKSRLLLIAARLLYAAAAALLTVTVLYLVLHLPVFKLREIQISGPLEYVTAQQLQFIMTQELRGNFFSVDLNRLRTALEKLPWVRKVQLRKRWPDRLEAILEEHRVLARWGDGKLVNTHGELFNAAFSRELPLFLGPPGSEQEVAQWYGTFRQLLAPLKRFPERVTLTPRRAWELQLDNGVKLALGREKMDARLAKLTSVYTFSLRKYGDAIAYIDLRYPNGFAVKLTAQGASG